MTITELIEELSELAKIIPQNSEVVMSKDGEGNAFSPVGFTAVGFYVPDTTWSGEFHETGIDPSNICLWPVN